MKKRDVNKYATAHLPKGRECPTPPITNESSSSIWWAVLGGRGTSAWGGIPGFPPPCMKPCVALFLITSACCCIQNAGQLTSKQARRRGPKGRRGKRKRKPETDDEDEAMEYECNGEVEVAGGSGEKVLKLIKRFIVVREDLVCQYSET